MSKPIEKGSQESHVCHENPKVLSDSKRGPSHRKQVMEKELDQSILDEIGCESTDSDDSWDTLPAPSLYSKPLGSILSRSKSFGSLHVSVRDEECFESVNSMTTQNPKSTQRVVFDDNPARLGLAEQGSQPSSLTTLRRSVSLSSLQTSRSDYNRAVGEAIANSPKKGAGSLEQDLAVMEQLLSEL